MISPTDPRSLHLNQYLAETKKVGGGADAKAPKPLGGGPSNVTESDLPTALSVTLSKTSLIQQQFASAPRDNRTQEVDFASVVTLDRDTSTPVNQPEKARADGPMAGTLAATVAQANIDFNQENALDLAFQAALKGINKALAPILGEGAIEAGYASGLDVSPEATAGRIVSMATGFFAAFQDQNPEMTEKQSRERFSDIISGGVESGFADAKSVLEGLGVLSGSIAENIDTTYTLVFEGIDAFRQGASDTQPAPDSTVSDADSAQPAEQLNTAITPKTNAYSGHSVVSPEGQLVERVNLKA